MKRLLGLVLLLGLIAPAQAAAHAQLEETVPQRGAVLRQQPEQVVFRFSEPVEGNFGAVRVFDASGRRVDEGDAFHPGDRGNEIAVHLRDGLADGTYTATYRVVSADAHVISSGVVFSIGEASAAGKTVAELLGGQDTGPVTDAVFGVARGLQFAAIAIAVGALAFLLLVWRGVLAAGVAPAAAATAFVRRHRRLVAGAALLGAFSAAAGVVLQGAEAAGVTGFDALRPSIVKETLGTRFGTVWGIGVVAWLALAALAAFALRPRAGVDREPAAPSPVALLAFAPLAAFLLLLPALSGHASVQSPVWLLLPANALHVAAMSVWVGGLATLLLALPAATRALPERGDRSRLLAATLLRFSPLALCAVIAIVLSGTVQGVVEVRTVAHLFDTAFGRAVLVKLVLLLALIGLGAVQRRRVLPRLRVVAAAGAAPGGAGLLLRRTLRGELLLIAGVLAATAFLTAYAPSTAERSGPFDRTTELGPIQLQLTVDPAAVGSNELHVYLLNPRDGSQFDGAREVTIAATEEDEGIGPLDAPADKAGPGHYVANVALGVPGTWTVRVSARVSDFDEYTTRVEVPVR
ncbi:copper resistance CopC/CopD family protein [Conexibacter woesei]|uniref:Copper resistance protein CopC n=1 Tax=Conexibacter woesei (strain DSM 14684 / CCUG 47730 / CIP 108061 / JCM 11494 / NBRC 100937 / ID131577) TaxID=469383 RepID=D3F2P6_CONWI|nr:copper resistance protein CopC [Conexibacter woesei]ADB54177.1 copper resistance protein CopC [Conexibacter woesei DSM 14684]